MTLNFGNNLFKGDPEDNLKDRWQQSGSTLINLTFQTNLDATIYTVTANKRLYVSTITYQENTASANIQLKDGGAGGTTKLEFNSVTTGGVTVINFSAPIYFDTDIYCNEVTTSTGYMMLTGWEEAV